MADPNRQSNLPPPPVHIEEVIANRPRTYDLLSKLALPPLHGQLEIDYTALSFKVPPEEFSSVTGSKVTTKIGRMPGPGVRRSTTNLPPRVSIGFT